MSDKLYNRITDNLDELLALLPDRVTKAVRKEQDLDSLREIILDLGRSAELRYSKSKTVYIEKIIVTQDDIDFVVDNIGAFNDDNRAGIERTLHRVSCIRNRQDKIIGLTCRVGRSVYGTIDIISDLVSSGKSLLVMGAPGVGKTTMLREITRVLACDYHKRVIVVDTSNEIAGDGDIPHPAIGSARRMQVKKSFLQHAVMIEAVENHMPEVIIVDEIGTEEEANAARTIAERGVQLIATAHGTNIENLIKNPTLADLVGGIQSVILGDEEAKKRNTQKTVLERKAPPTFQCFVEIHDRNSVGIYYDLALTVDAYLQGKKPKPELRKQEEDGSILLLQEESTEVYTSLHNIELDDEAQEKLRNDTLDKRIAIYAFGVNRARMERAINVLNVNAKVTMHVDEADIVVTTKVHNKPNSNLMQSIKGKQIPINVIKSDTMAQITRFLKYVFKIYNDDEDKLKMALREVDDVLDYIEKHNKVGEVSPASSYVRRLQKHRCADLGFRCESTGEEPNRRVRIFPKR